ncbi:hypothetical protein BP5796_04313 [Coleophoma crateriformis]|uniref:AB hydrolase-1 domain-containing protein n=1 Tax=Coleophoma crateriformis TaxID=565419 RepID=A0A3D8SJN6_9HELO|nr:hypothetical protein BP5796_04313 [Coleophoma crateriformis]
MAFPTPIRAFYDTPEGQIHYRYLHASVKDASKQPIILMHMSACSSLYYIEMMQLCAAVGYDCYAPDMPGFGDSYNPTYYPSNIRWYVEVFQLLVKHVGLTKFHVLGHHSGASIATEMAAVYPDEVLSLCVIGPALLTEEEQVGERIKNIVAYNEPVMDGSHLQKCWDVLATSGTWEVEKLHEQTLDAARAWQGRLQIYTCVFHQPMIEVLSQVKCPVLGLCGLQDVLYPQFGRVKEIQPTATCVVVKGEDFEPLKDAEGCSKAMLEFYGKL